MSIKEIVEKANYIEFYQNFVPVTKTWMERYGDLWDVTFITDSEVDGYAVDVTNEKIEDLIIKSIDLINSKKVLGGFAVDKDNKIIKTW